MGSDDLFKKRRAKLQERKKETRTPKPNSFLIVSEGKKTEPLYFEGLANHINEKYGKSIDIEKPLITPRGEGKSTVSLVEEAAKIASRAPIMYSQVWVVFDKDDFDDFDEAVALAEKYGFKVAWSNQPFEYWLYLHFNYSDSALHRDDWVSKLSNIFKDLGINDNGYEKNNPNIFEIATTYGSIKFAITNAIRVEKLHVNKTKPSLCDPCTMVYLLIMELKPYLSDLLG